MRILALLIIGISFALGCRQSPGHVNNVRQDPAQYTPNSSNEAGGEFEIKIDRKELSEESGCLFKDGLHPASVKYYNPRTAHTNKYDLIVHIKQCNVVQIDFPNGGWLDEDHIPATPITRDGEARLTDDKGRIWQVHINKKKDD